MTAILKRELHSYFITPIGYLYLGVFYFFAGFYFAGYALLQSSADLTAVFSSLFTICVFLIPVLTMRLMSEDRKHKTDQLLLTLPMRLSSLVLGKFLAAFCIFSIGACAAPMLGLAVEILGTADWPVILGNFIGLLLLGAALISIGMFLSALTENQVIAALGGFAAGLFLVMTDNAASLLQNELARTLLSALSFQRHYAKFTRGLLDVCDIVFFLSITAAFVFLTVRTLESRRWR